MPQIQAPPSLLLQTQNYPAQHKALLDTLLPQLQGQFDPIRSALAGGLTRANTAAQDLIVNVATPASDWIQAVLWGPGGPTSFTSNIATGNNFNAPRWRWTQGGFLLDGACEWNSQVGTVAIPTQVLTNVPVTQASGTAIITDLVAGWMEMNAAGGAGITYAAPWLGRYDPTQGTISIRSAGTAALASPWGIPFMSFGCIFPTPGVVPPPLSCFPIKNVQTTVTQPTRVTISQILDVTTPVPSNVFIAPGSLYWVSSAPGNITIQNIAGLALGRNYQVTLCVEP